MIRVRATQTFSLIELRHGAIVFRGDDNGLEIELSGRAIRALHVGDKFNLVFESVAS